MQYWYECAVSVVTIHVRPEEEEIFVRDVQRVCASETFVVCRGQQQISLQQIDRRGAANGDIASHVVNRVDIHVAVVGQVIQRGHHRQSPFGCAGLEL